MSQTTAAPYGSWKSPITSDLIVSATVGLGQIALGGEDFAVRDGAVYFSNFSDQRVYRQRTETAPRPITPEGRMRYSDFVIDDRRERLFAVREDHTAEGRE